MPRTRRPQRAGQRLNRSHSELTWEQLEARQLMAADIHGREYVPDEIVIQYTAQAGSFHQNRARAAIGGEVKEVIQTRIMQEAGVGRLERVGLSRGADLASVIQEIQRDPAVAYAEPNYIFRRTAVSNDPTYTSGLLWGMYSNDSPMTGPGGTTNPFGSQAEKAWANNITGSSNIVVGVIDEGIQVTHPDLSQNIWVNPYEVSGDGIDNDGNGYVDDIYGWDFVNNDNSVYDIGQDSHGTHVAGTIGAKGGNGIGVAGVNWNVKMISAKFLGLNGGTLVNAVRAVDYLTDLKVRHGINLVASNNSWEGGGYSQSLHDAIIRHAKQNILFVAAAGNSTSNNDAVASYPSNYNTTQGTSTQTPASYDGVIAVASITNTGAISSFSSFGATTVDIGAPGSGIWSTVPTSTGAASYASYDGTSMATPHVTGAVALYASAQTGPTSAAAIKQAVLNSAAPTASLAGKTLTGGRLDVAAALNLGTDQIPPTISGLSVNAGSLTATLTWTTDELATTEVLYGTNPGNLDQIASDNSLVMSHSAGITGLSAQTTYYFRARSRDAVGNTTTTGLQSFTTLASAPILFVDDDMGEGNGPVGDYDRHFTAALQAGGYAFDTWNVAVVGTTPSSAALANYELVIWNTGYAYTGTGAGLSVGEQAAIANYLNTGGRVFISGQDVLYNGVSSAFQQDYLKVASFTNDVQQAAHTATGLSNNPISSGMSLPIAGPGQVFPALYVDAVTPAAGAQGLLNHGVSTTSPFSAVSYRGDYNTGGFGLVFSTVPFETMSRDAGNPNNQASFLKRTIEFLLPGNDPVPEIRVSTPTPGSTTTEAGGAVSFLVVLATQPTENVIIPLYSSDTSEGSMSAPGLFFTPANWNMFQVVTVTGVNDHLDDGNIAFWAILGPAISTDPAYSGLDGSDVLLNNLDDDTAGITLGAPSSTTTTEAGGTATFSLRLNSEPTGNVTVVVSSSDPTEGTVSVSSLVFTASDWNLPKSVTVTGVNDDLDDGDIPYSIILGNAVSSDTSYNGMDINDVLLGNLDNDTAGITRGTPSSATTTEAGGSSTFTLRLNSQPTANVTIGISSSDATEGTVSTPFLVFSPANWNIAQVVMVTGVDDSIADGDLVYNIIVAPASSMDPLYDGFNADDFQLTNLDNDQIPSSKFYVVNDGTSQNRTYEYDANGNAVENYSLQSGNSTPRGAAMTAAGDKVWVVDANRTVYIYNTSGGLLGSWAAKTLASNAIVQGIATDGTHIWIVDSRTDRVFYYANAAARLSGSQTATSFALGSGNTSPSDLVFGSDGTNRYLWVVNNSTTDRIYRYSVGSGGGLTLLNSWALNSANSNPTGITLDPANGSFDLWVVDKGTDRVYRYANARNLSDPTLTSSFALSAGNTNPQGIADPPPASSGGETQERVSGRVPQVSTLDPPALHVGAVGFMGTANKSPLEAIDGSYRSDLAREISDGLNGLGEPPTIDGVGISPPRVTAVNTVPYPKGQLDWTDDSGVGSILLDNYPSQPATTGFAGVVSPQSGTAGQLRKVSGLGAERSKITARLHREISLSENYGVLDSTFSQELLFALDSLPVECVG